MLLRAPEVIGTLPYSNDVEVPLDGTISISFSKSMNKASVEKALTITPKMDGSINWSGNTLTFTPSKPFDRNTYVGVNIKGKARSVLGLKLEKELHVNFKTLSNPEIAFAAPTGSITEPVENIVLIFNKSVKIPEGSILKIEPPVTGEEKWVGSTAYVVKPDNLKTGERYKVTLTSEIESLDGGVMSSLYNFEFVNNAPAVLNIEASGKGYIQNTDSDPRGPISVYFSQFVDQTSVLENLKLIGPGGESIPYRVTVRNRTAKDYSDYYYQEWQEKWQQKYDLYPLQTLMPSSIYTVDAAPGIQSAVGSAVTENGYTLNFTTAGLPGYLGSNIASGSQDVRDPSRLELRFNTLMDAEDAARKAVITKNGNAVSEDMFVYASSYNKTLNFNRYLERSSSYSFFIPANTLDVYGRPLGQDIRIAFTTAEIEPNITLYPYSSTIATFSSSLDTRFITRVVNVPEIEYKLYALSKDEFMNMYETSTSSWYLFTQKFLETHNTRLVKRLINRPELEQNVVTDILFNVNRDMDLDLSPGLYFLDISYGATQDYVGQTHDSILFVVGDAALTQKITSSQTMTWAASLSTATALSNYDISTYKLQRRDTYQGTAQRNPIFSGKTNQDGVYMSENATDKDYSNTFVTFAEKEGDIGILMDNWDSGISPYMFDGVYTGYRYRGSGNSNVKGFIMSDRRLYRPGQSVYYTAFVRKNNIYEFPKEVNSGKVEVRVQSYYGSDDIYDNTFEVGPDKMYSGEFVLPEGLELGYYNLQLIYENQVIYNASFDVQEYVRPDFEVVTEAPKGVVSRGDAISINTLARYFYGAPLVNADLDYRLYQRDYIFNSSKYSDYAFYSGRKYYGDDYDWSGFSETEIASGEGYTNTSGVFKYSPQTITDEGVSEIYTFETEVTGENGRRFSGSDEYIVHMADYYTGIKSDSYLGEVSKDSKFDLVVIDPLDNPVEDKKININVYLRKYYRVKQKDNSEGYMYKTTYEDTLVENDDVKTDSKGKAQFTFIPKNAGHYIIEAQSRDKDGNLSTADVFHYVSGKEAGYWRQENHDRIELVTDKSEYSPDDTVNLIPISTLEKAVGLLTIEAEGVLDYKLIKQDNSGQAQDFKVNYRYVPNVFVSLMLVSPGQDVFNPPQFKMGLKNIKVDASKNLLSVDFSTDKQNYSPKEEGKVRVLVKDKSGNPVKDATVTLAIVDDALMSIANYARDDTFNYYYSPRTLNVTTYQSLTTSLDRINLNTEVGSKGGSGSKGGEGGEYPDLTRSNFVETALWLPEVKTDANGVAEVTFKLPDSVTRWNVFALAQDAGGSKFGQNVYKFGSSRELFGLPAMPRFLRTGDKAELGIVVHNNTDAAKAVSVKADLSGIKINGSTEKFVQVPSNTQKKVLFEAIADDVSNASATFTLSENGTPKDILVTELPVLPFGLDKVQYFSNSLKYSAKEEFEIEPSVLKEYGALDVKVYGSMLGLSQEWLQKMHEVNYLFVSSLTSRIVPAVYSYKLALFEGNSEEAERIKAGIINDITLLKSVQKSDGGWGYWINSRGSDAINTIYALEALGEVTKAGINVGGNSLASGLSYALAHLNSGYYSSGNMLAYVLYVLELNKSNQAGRLADLYSKRAAISDLDKAYLIMAMSESSGNWSKHEKQLQNELIQKADLGAGRIFWDKTNTLSYCYYSCGDFSITAVVLRAFNRTAPDSPVANLAMKYLTQEQNYSWLEREKTTALIENTLMRNIKPRDNVIELLVNGVSKIKSALDMLEHKVLEFSVPISEMKDGSNIAELKAEKGGNSFYSMNLKTFNSFDSIKADSNDIALLREIYDMQGRKVTNGQFKVGENYVVKLTIASPNTRRNVALEDFLPGGFESVNGTLKNEASVQASKVSYDSENAMPYLVDSQQMKDSVTQLEMSYLPEGLFEFAYIMRAIIPGEFKYRPAQVYEINSPDIRANTEGAVVTVVE